LNEEDVVKQLASAMRSYTYNTLGRQTTLGPFRGLLTTGKATVTIALTGDVNDVMVVTHAETHEAALQTAHKKVNALIEENATLKETVKEHEATIKSLKATPTKAPPEKVVITTLPKPTKRAKPT